MPDREQMIENLIRESVRMGIGWPKSESLDRWVSKKVDEFLTVFEQSSAPTGHECTWACFVDKYGQDHYAPTDQDEREAILSILADLDYNDGGMMRWSSGRPTEQAEKVADRIVREVIHLTPAEHPEPVGTHNHAVIQHRDGKPPWCPTCGLTADGNVPVSRFERAEHPEPPSGIAGWKSIADNNDKENDRGE